MKWHGRITEWTQHISFLKLAGMELVVEGNHGNDLKEGLQEFCVYRVWRSMAFHLILEFNRKNEGFFLKITL